jgi:hypothetical protein
VRNDMDVLIFKLVVAPPQLTTTHPESLLRLCSLAVYFIQSVEHVFISPINSMDPVMVRSLDLCTFQFEGMQYLQKGATLIPLGVGER